MEFLLRIWGNKEIKREISLFCMRDRASDHPKSVGKLTFGLLKINSIERKISIKDEPINLTSKEFDILFFLASHPGQVFTHRQIYETVWGKEYFCDEGNITAHIGRIRKKIEPDPRNPVYIQTVQGVGYKFVKK